MSDIIHNYDIRDFKVGDSVYGTDTRGIYFDGELDKIDLLCPHKMRFRINNKTLNYSCWFSIVNKKENGEKN